MRWRERETEALFAESRVPTNSRGSGRTSRERERERRLEGERWCRRMRLGWWQRWRRRRSRRSGFNQELDKKYTIA